jgi:hypothetical protein
MIRQLINSAPKGNRTARSLREIDSGSSLEMPQPQFLTVACDDPTELGRADQVLNFRFREQGRQPILRGFGRLTAPVKGQRFQSETLPRKHKS